MKNLYFMRSNDTYLLIKENIPDIETALKEISAFLNRHNYKSYYTRYWNSGEITIFDVGSWSECFKLAAPGLLPAKDIVGNETNFIDRKVETK